MLHSSRFPAFPVQIASILLIGLTTFLSVNALAAQSTGDLSVVARAGFIHATAAMGPVRLSQFNDAEIGRVGPGFQLGIGLQRVMGDVGWTLEAGVSRSFLATVPSVSACFSDQCTLQGSVADDLRGTIATASIAATTPHLGSLPIYLKGGLGVKRQSVDGEGALSQLQGSASDTGTMFLLGIGIQWQLAGIPVELELVDLGSNVNFGIEQRFTNELSLSLGVPIRLHSPSPSRP